MSQLDLRLHASSMPAERRCRDGMDPFPVGIGRAEDDAV
jgi:hypothetical protein